MRAAALISIGLLMATASAASPRQAVTTTCFVLELVDTGASASIPAWLRLEPSRSDGGWAPAEILAPRTAIARWQKANWLAPTPDSVHVTWSNPYSGGMFRLQRTSGGFAGVLESYSDVHVVDSSGVSRPYRQVEKVRASRRSCPGDEL